MTDHRCESLSVTSTSAQTKAMIQMLHFNIRTVQAPIIKSLAKVLVSDDASWKQVE